MATANQGNETPKTKKTKVKHLRVASKKEGFRRAGFAWSEKPTDIPLADLDKDQIKAIKGEPMLLCQEVDLDVEVPAEE